MRAAFAALSPALKPHVQRALARWPTWPVPTLALAWAVGLFVAGGAGMLGPDPVDAITGQTGTLALAFLVLGLWLSPLRRLTGLPLQRWRRAFGLSAFAFVAAHALTWALLDLGLSPERLLAEILRAPFLSLGMGALLLLVPLAATSWDGAMRRMGPVRWRALHRLTYLAVALACIHFAMGSKVWEGDHALWIGLAAAALAERAWRWWQGERM